MARYRVKARGSGKTRTEIINTKTNSLFAGLSSPRSIKSNYEAFWALDKYSPRVKVLSVKKI